jgi:hypothetical protein
MESSTPRSSSQVLAVREIALAVNNRPKPANLPAYIDAELDEVSSSIHLDIYGMAHEYIDI